MNISTEHLYPNPILIVTAISEKGGSHEFNEDAYRIDPKNGLFIVADGMGGHQAGEIASRLAVDVLYRALVASSSSSIKDTIVSALLDAHKAILSMASENEKYLGMGTTALIGWVCVSELTLWTGHVGNSRAYLWREGKLERLTDDHTLLNELRKANKLSDNPRDWPSPVILTQALGARQPFLFPEVREWSLQVGDRLLFCSDGISDVLTDDEISEIITDTETPQSACEQLIQAVKNKCGQDDMTAIVVYIEAQEVKQNSNQI